MNGAIPEISIADLELAEHVGRRLIDVREDDEWAVGHVDGAVHIAMSSLPGALASVPQEPLVVMCKVGARSAQVTGWLCAQGFDAVNLDGGAIAWTASGRALIAADGTPGTVL